MNQKRLDNPIENKYIEKYKKYDLVLVVLACDSKDKYRKQIIKIQQTYENTINKNKLNIKILYFLGKKHKYLLNGRNMVYIDNLEDDYSSVWYKQFYGLNYVYKHFDFKFVMCVGTDAFINVYKLMDFLEGMNPDGTLYIGGHGCRRNINNKSIYFHSGGPGFILSKSCLEKFYPKISNVKRFLDEWANICINSNQKNLISAGDVAIGYLAQTEKIKIIKVKKGFYHCNYKGIPCHRDQVHVENIISCHNMSLKDFDNFNAILLNNNFYMFHMDFITGEKIQCECSHFIGTNTDFKYNPNIQKYKGRHIELGRGGEITHGPLIFCYTHVLDNTEVLIITLKSMKNLFKLIFHNSDRIFSSKHLILFDKLPLLQHIYTQNMNVVHPKVTALPIGLANSQHGHGDPRIHREIYNINVPKIKNIYFNFNINTNKQKRQECYGQIRALKQNIPWNETKPYKGYLTELKSHKYAICPEGNGLDTHRFWECLYMNVIPICKRNTLVEYYSKYFPIVILDNWSELDLAKIDRQYSDLKINHRYLDLQYIKHLLTK